MTEPVTHDDGLYFGLDEDAYHADPALSSTGIRNLEISPLTYWVRSHMNPGWPGYCSPAMEKGKAFHKRILEGADAFSDAYAVLPDRDDYPDALDGAADLRAWLQDHELPRSGTIAEMCARIQEADPDVELWPVMEREFRDANEGKEFIKRDMFDEIEFRAGIIERHPHAKKAFIGGYPEVSVFWRDPETGIRLKARHDYLKAKATINLKTFSNPFQKSLHMAIMNRIATNRYHVQAALYLESAWHAKRMVEAGRVFGEAPADWLEAFAATPAHAYVFVFLETGDVPNVAIREYRKERAKGEFNFYWTSGMDALRKAITLFVRCTEAFGTDPWIMPEPMKPLQDDDFPLWMTE